MYREFVHVIKAYFSNTRRIELFFDFLLPLIIVGSGRYCIIEIDKKPELLNSILTIASIIMGFTIAALTVILTNNSDNIKSAKKTVTEKKVFNATINLYQSLLIPFFYVAVICLIGILFIIAILSFGLFEEHRILIDISIFIILHIVLVEIRSITNLFFLVFPSIKA